MDKAAARVKAACRLPCDLAIGRPMKDRRDQPADDRAARLAEALRANLRRRKAQARAAEPAPRAAGTARPPVDDDPDP